MSAFNGKLLHQDWMVAEDTQSVMRALLADGGDARFVGGCVRNALCNRKVIDIDIATPLKPEQVIARLEQYKIPYAPTGLKHGTVTALVDGNPFEITTLRLDVTPFGRHAEVRFTDDWQTDAARRDFTINAMSATVDGDIFDPFGGIEDLRDGRVVFVGDPERRIGEDILRILRYFRFLAHFGKGLPDATALRACAKLAHLLPRLSRERIRQETLKLLESDRCAEVWGIMLRSGVVTHFLPEGTNVRILERLIPLEHKYESPAFSIRRLAAVIDATEKGLQHVIAELKLSNAQGAQLRHLALPDESVDTHMEHASVRRKVYRQGSDMVRSLLLLAAAREGEENDLGNLYHLATTFRPPRFPLTGEDVMALGWKPGPDIGGILEALEEWWLREDFRPGRTECLSKLRQEYARR